MTNRRLLIASIAILITTTIIVAVFGIVPLPNYEDLASENNFEGKLIYYVERQSENIMPPACLLYTSPSPRDLSTSRMPSSA